MLEMRIKQLFFDKQVVLRAVSRAKRAVLSRAGAFIRQTARDSIRKRKGTAAPGKPPHSHTGLLRRFIFFGYEPGSESVVIGPVKLNQKRGEAPNILEFGGTTVIERHRRGRRVKRRV